MSNILTRWNDCLISWKTCLEGINSKNRSCRHHDKSSYYMLYIWPPSEVCTELESQTDSNPNDYGYSMEKDAVSSRLTAFGAELILLWENGLAWHVNSWDQVPDEQSRPIVQKQSSHLDYLQAVLIRRSDRRRITVTSSRRKHQHKTTSSQLSRNKVTAKLQEHRILCAVRPWTLSKGKFTRSFFYKRLSEILTSPVSTWRWTRKAIAEGIWKGFRS